MEIENKLNCPLTDRKLYCNCKYLDIVFTSMSNKMHSYVEFKVLAFDSPFRLHQWKHKWNTNEKLKETGKINIFVLDKKTAPISIHKLKNILQTKWIDINNKQIIRTDSFPPTRLNNKNKNARPLHYRPINLIFVFQRSFSQTLLISPESNNSFNPFARGRRKSQTSDSQMLFP